MRILEVFGEPILSGGQESFVINNVLQNIDISGMIIDVFTPYYCNNDYYEKIVNDKGGKIYCANLEFEPGKSRKNIMKPLSELINNNKYDVVHIHSGSISVLAYAAKTAKKCGVKKVIVHSHSSAAKIGLKNLILRNIMGMSMKKNVDIYCACSTIAGKVKFTNTVVNNNMRIIKNGVDLNKYSFNSKIRDEIRKKYKIENDSLVVGHVGRFSFEKNHEYTLEFFSEILKKNSNAYLMFVGDGDLKQDITNKIEQLGIKNNVIMTGNVNNVQDYLNAFDVFVLPSIYEGLPIVGVEAQAAGMPVFVSDGVSLELKLTNNIEFISLNEQAKWVDKILSVNVGERFNTRQQLKEAGFDIIQTADEIRNMYINQI